MCRQCTAMGIIKSRGKIMAKFYLIGKISQDLMQRMQNDPSADRYASTKKVTEAAGLKLISYEWVRGRFDVISCVEGEYEQAVALKISFKNSSTRTFFKKSDDLSKILLITFLT